MAKYHPMVIGNWKMHTTVADAEVMGQAIKNGLEEINHIEAVIAPPFTWIYPLSEIFNRHPLRHLSLAAQNIHQAEEGAFTGEISVEMVKPLCRYILLGHSERRQFGETGKITNQKVHRTLRHKLTPVIFIGEETRGAEPERTLAQAKLLTSQVEKKDYPNLVLVYEPIWAISGSKESEPAGARDIEQTAKTIKQYFGGEIRLLYGGSVNQDNVGELIDIEWLDGVVVGADSLKVKHFLAICAELAGKKDAAPTL